jgi:hypothetical protein
MMKRVLASIKRLSRYNVQVSVVEDGAEGNTVDAARVKMMARQRKKKACRRRRHARRIMSTNAVTAGDEEEDGGSDEEGNGVGDGEERTNDSSHLGPMTERELSSIFMMDETGEPEWHWTRTYTPYSSAAALKHPTDTKRAESGSPISRPLKPANLQALPYILVHRIRDDSDLVQDAEAMQNA